jgi:hypothetical protein
VSDRDVDEFVAAAMSHRRGPQSVEALVAENERLRKDAQTGIRGIRGTRRGAGVVGVGVEFTDEGWEATKRVLSALAAAGGTGAAPEEER